MTEPRPPKYPKRKPLSQPGDRPPTTPKSRMGSQPASVVKTPLVRLGDGCMFDPSTVVSAYVKHAESGEMSMVVWISRTSGITVHPAQVYDGNVYKAFEKLMEACDEYRASSN
ncbi:hypothetical protein HOV23_gp073 [Pseudomonas phage Lana]|uniref:Uncharacterized protein n=1 Tax=Pseudomonas phage Lana TaxID=2530172 RepID=A0A481W6X4_9CAUD|nr:hypothetical protein HOV23_gp073 [Pseudomonas phage Lana]QBJ04500.1 hypothetical protein [Pseudomonas phage Lana]